MSKPTIYELPLTPIGEPDWAGGGLDPEQGRASGFRMVRDVEAGKCFVHVPSPVPVITPPVVDAVRVEEAVQHKDSRFDFGLADAERNGPVRRLLHG